MIFYFTIFRYPSRLLNQFINFFAFIFFPIDCPVIAFLIQDPSKTASRQFLLFPVHLKVSVDLGKMEYVTLYVQAILMHFLLIDSFVFFFIYLFSCSPFHLITILLTHWELTHSIIQSLTHYWYIYSVTHSLFSILQVIRNNKFNQNISFYFNPHYFYLLYLVWFYIILFHYILSYRISFFIIFFFILFYFIYFNWYDFF